MLADFWFVVIAILWAGYLVLEGFDYGVGMLVPFLGRNEDEQAQALRTIGPVWDGNEVWLLTAGGATFAAFPEWYASAFSGFYIPFALLLVGLIIRGIGIEYHHRAETAAGRAWCIRGIAVGSFLPSLLIGVAFANFVRGVEMNSQHVMTGGFWSLISVYTVLGGLVTLTLFLYHGATFLGFRTTGDLSVRAQELAKKVAPVTAVLAVALLVWTTQVRGGWVSFVIAALIVVTFVVSALNAFRDRDGAAFWFSALTALLIPAWAFAALWPNVLPARNNEAFSLTIHNASSSHYTLVVMTVVALIFTPIVLAYQAWTYWIFRARVGLEDAHSGYGEGTPPATTAGKLKAKARHAAGDPAAT